MKAEWAQGTRTVWCAHSHPWLANTCRGRMCQRTWRKCFIQFSPFNPHLSTSTGLSKHGHPVRCRFLEPAFAAHELSKLGSVLFPRDIVV